MIDLGIAFGSREKLEHSLAMWKEYLNNRPASWYESLFEGYRKEINYSTVHTLGSPPVSSSSIKNRTANIPGNIDRESHIKNARALLNSPIKLLKGLMTNPWILLNDTGYSFAVWILEDLTNTGKRKVQTLACTLLKVAGLSAFDVKFNFDAAMFRKDYQLHEWKAYPEILEKLVEGTEAKLRKIFAECSKSKIHKPHDEKFTYKEGKKKNIAYLCCLERMLEYEFSNPPIVTDFLDTNRLQEKDKRYIKLIALRAISYKEDVPFDSLCDLYSEISNILKLRKEKQEAEVHYFHRMHCEGKNDEIVLLKAIPKRLVVLTYNLTCLTLRILSGGHSVAPVSPKK